MAEHHDLPPPDVLSLNKDWSCPWQLWVKVPKIADGNADEKKNDGGGGVVGGGGGDDDHDDESDDFLSLCTRKGAVINSFKEFISNWSMVSDPTSRYTDIFLFREGIPPEWDHPAMVDGGRLVIPVLEHCSHTATLRKWMGLVIEVFVNDWDSYYSICGIGMAFREWGDFVSLWNTTAYSKSLVKSLKKEIRPVTNGAYVGYKTFKEKKEKANTKPV